MAARRTKAVSISLALLAAAALWIAWPTNSGRPDPESRTGPESDSVKSDGQLAPAPLRLRPSPVVPVAPVPVTAVASTSIEGGILEGKVRDAEGRLAAGVVVTALEPDEPPPPRRQGHMWYVGEADVAAAKARQRSAVSDGAGHYEIRGVPLATEMTAAVHVTDRLDGRSEPVTFSRSGERQRRDVEVPRAGSVLVTFVGRSVRSSPVGGQITFQGPTGWVESFDESNQKDGAWLVEGLRPGTYTIQMFPPDAPVESRGVEVRAGERTIVELSPPTGKSLDGIVVDPKGASVPNASVRWIGSGSILGETDAAGRFHFEGIVDDVGSLRVHSFGHGSKPEFVQKELEGVVPGGDPVRVVLTPPPHVIARIVGLDPTTPVTMAVLSRRITTGHQSQPAGDGRVDVGLIESSVPTLLILKVAGFAPRIVDVVGPLPGGVSDLGDLSFDKGRTIVGVVRNERGAVVPGVTVLVAEKWLDEAHETSADGAFRFERMPDRATEVRVNAPGYPVHIIVIPAGPAGESPTITVTHGGTLTVRVVDDKGAAVGGASVSFAPDGPHPYDVDYDKTRRSGEADAEGSLRAQLQSRGHRISAYEGKRQGSIESVVVVEGESSSIELRIR